MSAARVLPTSVLAVLAPIGAILHGPRTGLALQQTSSSIEEDFKLVPASASGIDVAGFAVALTTNTAVLGAPNGEAAYIFQESGGTWMEVTQLASGVEGQFGYSVAAGADDVFVGSPTATHLGGNNAGEVRLFQRNWGGPNNWGEVKRIAASDPEEDDAFGFSVAIDVDTVVVGSRSSDPSGAAYVFMRNQGGPNAWGETQKLVPSDPSWRFGEACSVHGNTAVIGAPGSNLPGIPAAGAAYMFQRAGVTGVWQETGKLVADSPASSDEFGISVDVFEGTIIVGCGSDDNALGPNAGSAYVFEWDEGAGAWMKTAKLLASDGFGSVGIIGDEFGMSVAIGSAGIIIGARNHTHSGVERAGSAYVFVFNQFGTGFWEEEYELIASDPGDLDLLGYSVAAVGNDFLAGAPYANAAYEYDVALSVGDNYCTAGISASGCSAAISAAGDPSATASNGFILTASFVEGAKDGLFFYGANGQQAVPWGTGFQCVVPPVKRCGLLPGIGSANACDGVFGQDINALWCPTCPKANHNPGAGATVQAQFWYRDPWNTATTKSTTMSDAIEFVVGL